MKNKALFLDRDGVINVDKNYVYRACDFEFKKGIFELCEFFLKKGYEIFVITNQSGIARGFYSENDFENLSKFMLAEFAKKGVEIKKIYHCPHLEGCECRKPKPGMILKAQAEFDIDLANSIFIGDNITDMESGKNAGVKTLCLVQENDTQSDKKSEFLGEIAQKNKGFELKSEIQGKSDENSSKNAEFYKKFSNLAEIKEFFKEKL